MASMVKIPERDILKSVLHFMRIHPAVAWCERMNVAGAQKIRGQYVQFGFKGCPDIIGMTRTGQFIGIECKSATGRLSAEQRAFLAKVQKGGGIAIVARSLDDVMPALDSLLRRPSAPPAA